MSELLIVQNGVWERAEVPPASYQTVDHFETAGCVFNTASENGSCLVQATSAAQSSNVLSAVGWYSSVVRSRPTLVISCDELRAKSAPPIGSALNAIKSFFYDKADYSRRPVLLFGEIDRVFPGENLDLKSQQRENATILTGYMGRLVLEEKAIVCAFSNKNVWDIPGADPLLEILAIQCALGEDSDVHNTKLPEPSAQPQTYQAPQPETAPAETWLDRVSAQKFAVFAAQVAAMGINQAV